MKGDPRGSLFGTCVPRTLGLDDKGRQVVAIAGALQFKGPPTDHGQAVRGARTGPGGHRADQSIRRLSAEGVAIYRLAVVKNGRLVSTCRTEDVTKDDVLTMTMAAKRVVAPA